MKFSKLFFYSLCLAVVSNSQAIADSGNQSGTFKPFVVGGTPATADRYPWMTALLGKKSKQSSCGANLIGDKWVLTAAHCVISSNPGSTQAYIGGLSLTDLSGGELRDVSRIYIHEQYNDETLDNDIALLKLATPSSKRPVELASVQLDDSLAEGTTLYIAGWGATGQDRESPASDVLLHTDVPLRNHKECDYSDYNMKVTDKMLCAGKKTEAAGDTCAGDSGGPLLVPEGSNDYKLLGISSFTTTKCALGHTPGVFTRVSRYLDWIAGKMDGSTTPDLTVLPSSRFSFGLIGVGLESTREVTLANDSNSSILVQSTMISGDPEFSIQSDTCQQKVLEADQQCSVIIKFSSPEEGSKSAKLSFSTSSDKNPTVTVDTHAMTAPKADLGEALDNTNLPWFTGSDFPWVVDNDSSYVNGSAAKSGDLQSDRDYSVLTTQVTGPGTITFRWKAAPKKDNDFIRFAIDGLGMAMIDGEADWNTQTWEIADGTHELSWMYSRLQGATGLYGGLLDNVQFTDSSATPEPTPEPTSEPTQDPSNDQDSSYSWDYSFSCNDLSDCPELEEFENNFDWEKLWK
jgi:secreted trypsin-like serine protease